MATDNGAQITTGVLVVASTAALNDPPPWIYASTSPAAAILYSVASRPDGTYSLDVRSSAGAYNMRAFYPMMDLKTGVVTYTSKSKTGISVGAGAVVVNQNFTWP